MHKTVHASNQCSHNPQANAYIEWIHKVVDDKIRSFDLDAEHLEEDNALDYFLQHGLNKTLITQFYHPVNW